MLDGQIEQHFDEALRCRQLAREQRNRTGGFQQPVEQRCRMIDGPSLANRLLDRTHGLIRKSLQP